MSEFNVALKEKRKKKQLFVYYMQREQKKNY